MIVLTWCFLLSKIFFWIWSLIHWIKIFGLFITSIFRFLLIIMFYIQALFIGLFKFYCLLFSFTSAGLYVINLKRCQQTGENAHERLHNTIQGKKKMIQKCCSPQKSSTKPIQTPLIRKHLKNDTNIYVVKIFEFLFINHFLECQIIKFCLYSRSEMILVSNFFNNR